MKRYMKYGIIAIVAVVALSAGITAVVSAQSPEAEVGSDTGPGQIFLSKVADILESDEEELADAFKQARQEMCEEMQKQRLQSMLEEGLITAEEAEQIQDWWDSRPEAMQQLGPPGHHMRNTWCHQMNMP
ncbi:MAG TPA: hypothetical protein VMX96_06100 [Dehalococcoidia bacterium]|nr:hypothetical protein [Dehalococcoidia bacterium]